MKRICLGKIVSAHGIRGLVKILPFGDSDPYLIEELGPVYISANGAETLSISMKNSAGNKYWLAAVDGVTERNGAEALRGTELYIPRERLPELDDPNTYYTEDLVGLRVLDTSGAVIGSVATVSNFGAGDLLEIQPIAGEAYYLPMTTAFVPAIDLSGGTVTIAAHDFDPTEKA